MITYTKYLLFISLLLLLIGCGSDDTTGPDVGKAPELPTVLNSQAQPDVSFFQENQPQNSAITASETTNYSTAQALATSGIGLFGVGQIYSGFVTPAQQADPDFQDGRWAWEYSYTFEGQTAELRLTAEEVTGGFDWEMFISFDDGQGTAIEDYKVLEGTTNESGSEGTWIFNALDIESNQETKAFTSSWTVTDDSQKNSAFEAFDENGSVVATGLYNQDTPEYTLSLTFSDSDDLSIFWNTETNEGYIQEGTLTQCWDEQFQNVDCS